MHVQTAGADSPIVDVRRDGGGAVLVHVRDQERVDVLGMREIANQLCPDLSGSADDHDAHT